MEARDKGNTHVNDQITEKREGNLTVHLDDGVGHLDLLECHICSVSLFLREREGIATQ